MQRDIQNGIIMLESFLKSDIEFPLLRLLQFLSDLKSYFIGLSSFSGNPINRSHVD